MRKCFARIVNWIYFVSICRLRPPKLYRQKWTKTILRRSCDCVAGKYRIGWRILTFRLASLDSELPSVSCPLTLANIQSGDFVHISLAYVFTNVVNIQNVLIIGTSRFNLKQLYINCLLGTPCSQMFVSHSLRKFQISYKHYLYESLMLPPTWHIISQFSLQ